MTRTLFTNATFWPGQVKSQTFGAMLVDGQKIVATGDEALSAAHDEKVDLGGAFVSVMVTVTQSLVDANTLDRK